MLEYLIDDSLVQSDDKIAVGVSGGVDSMLLLWALLDKQKKVGFYLKVINVNHNLRGDESDADSKFVSDFCDKKKVPCEILSVNVNKLKEENNYTLEEAARNARFDAIFSQMKKDGLNKLFLAHHKNDQAETVLMHIFRGAGLSGACGIRENDIIFRPLINLKRSEIDKLAKEYGIKFVTDSSNSDNKFTRNFLRNKIIPEIEKVYPTVVDSIADFAKKCNEVQKFIEKQVKNELVLQKKDEVLIELQAFNNENFIVREYLKLAFSKLGVCSDIEDKHYNMLIKLAGEKVNTTIDLPHKLTARKSYTTVQIFKKGKKVDKISELNFTVGEIVFEGYGKIKATKIDAYSVNYGDGTLYVDISKIPTDAVWRKRDVGDKFTMLGTGTKSLSDYYTDKKTEYDLRNNLPVLASGNKVLVIAGKDISELVKVDSTTDTIIKLEFFNDI